MFPPLAKEFWDFVMFPPTRGKVDMGRELQRMSTILHCHVADLFFSAPDGAKLHAYYFTLPSAKKTMLVSHGKGGIIAHRLPLAFLLMQAGCSVFLYDYEGYGESTGSADLPRVCRDGEAAFDYLTQVAKIKPEDIILYGESIGTGVSCELSQHRLAGGIILQSGFTSLYEAAKKVVPIVRIYPQWSFPNPQMNNAQILKKQHPPLLLIHGRKDQTLPCTYSEQMMIEASPPKRLVVLPHADHNDVGALDVPETIKALKDFVGELK
jgi:alpha-beta hydrolase superfamily lysophospholipase